jgi:adenosylcobinamide-GDP ribazoletransferase
VRLRGLRLATQFLTRLPLPSVPDFASDELSRSAGWFPIVGAAVGGLPALVLLLLQGRSVLLAAAVALLIWVWVTGALHLDGLGDLADALAASHRDPQRFLRVLADPHLGTFGVVSIVLALMLKLVALASLHPAGAAAIPLLSAWARLGPLAWSRWLVPLKPGHGERFGGMPNGAALSIWSVVLLAASALVAPVLCVAPLLLLAWGVWLRVRLGGMTGDCLGAGVEVAETVLLLLLAFAGTAGSALGQ